MAVTPDQLRLDFPEFADAVTYPDPTVAFWLAVASRLVLGCVWADMLDTATELFVCHQLTVSARAGRVARAGGIPGQAQGLLTSKSVDKAAAGYDVSQLALENGGHWNQSTYGIQFLQMGRLFGAQGAVQL